MLIYCITQLAWADDMDRQVQKRIAAMQEANTAIQTLGNLVQHPSKFDKSLAKASRRQLISVMGDVKRLFRKPREDPLSHALPNIWEHWANFSAEAERATDAAEGLDVTNARRLSKTLPPLLTACHDCHRQFTSY